MANYWHSGDVLWTVMNIRKTFMGFLAPEQEETNGACIEKEMHSETEHERSEKLGMVQSSECSVISHFE